MRELDKVAMGRRIKQIRLQRSLRQWELAQMLGTTQSAVHKYERGVVPEPRRLVELARIGGTSVEWVLTGQHWENGSEDQQRVPPEVLQTAQILTRVDADERASIDEALRIVRAAVDALAQAGRENSLDPSARALRGLSRETLKLLEQAWAVQRAVLHCVLEDTQRRLAASAPAGWAAPDADQTSDPSLD